MSDARDPELNEVTISGRLTRKPGPLRYLDDGTPFIEFGFVHNKRIKGGKKKAMFFEVQAWRKEAEWIVENLAKGMPVTVLGSLDKSEWEKDGKKDSATRIVARAYKGVRRSTWDDKPADAAPPPAPQDEEGDGVPF